MTSKYYASELMVFTSTNKSDLVGNFFIPAIKVSNSSFFFLKISKFLKCKDFSYYICECLKRGLSKQQLQYHGKGNKSIKIKA